MTYRYFQNICNGGCKVAEVIQIKVMSGIYTKSALLSLLCCIKIWFDSFFAIIFIASGIGFSIKLYAVASALCCIRNHFRYRIYED